MLRDHTELCTSGQYESRAMAKAKASLDEGRAITMLGKGQTEFDEYVASILD